VEVSVRDFRKKIEKKISDGALSEALWAITEFVSDIISHQSSVGRVLSSPDLDELCACIGELALKESRPENNLIRSRSHTIYLVTELSKTGGLTRLLLDIIECGGVGDHTILISNLNENTQYADIEALFELSNVSIHICPYSDNFERLCWLQAQLMRWRPWRTYVLPHHFDAPLIAACHPDIVGDLVYIHNCNHALALGIHLKGARHVDLHAKGFYYCRESGGISRNELWLLAAKDFGCRSSDDFLKGGKTLTCTSGGFEKFESFHFWERVPYAYRYEDILPSILLSTNGCHLHIGQLSECFLQELYRALQRSGIGLDRFIHVPFVPSLSRALLDYEVDIYIGSFPLGGGKATVEAMAAGIPLAVHSNYRSNLLSVESEVHPGACVWRNPEELCEFLRVQDKSTLKDLSQKSRAFYIANHTIGRLRAAMESRCELLPPRPLFRPDVLQSYLDDRQACWESEEKVIVSEEMAKHSQREKKLLFDEIDKLKNEVRDALLFGKSREDQWIKQFQELSNRLEDSDRQCVTLKASLEFQREITWRGIKRARSVINNTGKYRCRALMWRLGEFFGLR